MKAHLQPIYSPYNPTQNAGGSAAAPDEGAAAVEEIDVVRIEHSGGAAATANGGADAGCRPVTSLPGLRMAVGAGAAAAVAAACLYPKKSAVASMTSSMGKGILKIQSLSSFHLSSQCCETCNALLETLQCLTPLGEYLMITEGLFLR